MPLEDYYTEEEIIQAFLPDQHLNSLKLQLKLLQQEIENLENPTTQFKHNPSEEDNINE